MRKKIYRVLGLLKGSIWKSNSYPKEILPKGSYKLTIEVNQLPEDSVLLRRSVTGMDVSIDDLKLRDIKDKRDDIFDLSCSILGIFKKHHLKYNPINTLANKPWLDKNHIIKLSDIEFEKKVGFPVFINIKDFHNEPFPETRMHVLNEQNLESKIEGSFQVAHSPTNSNYWHFVINIHDTEGNKIEKDGVSERMKKIAEAFLKNTYKQLFSASLQLNPSVIPLETYTE